MSLPLLVSRTHPWPWPSSISIVLRWTPPRPPVSIVEPANQSHGFLFHRGFLAFFAGCRRRPCFSPSSVCLFNSLSLSVFVCTIVCYVCKFVWVCLWLRVTAVLDPFVRSELGNRIFELVFVVGPINWRFKDRPPWDDMEIHTGSCSEDQTAIWTRNRVISCKCTGSPFLWLFYFIEIIFELLILENVFRHHRYCLGILLNSLIDYTDNSYVSGIISWSSYIDWAWTCTKIRNFRTST